MILPGQKETFDKIITVLHDSGMTPYVILIGSWAEYIYEAVNFFEGYRSMMRTRDIDFLVRNLKKPSEKTDFLDRMRGAGFIIDISRGSGIHRFIQTDVDMEVEFLIQEYGTGITAAHQVKSLGIKVPGLRNLGILAAFPLTVMYNGIDIVVPIPEAYVIHKLVINAQRAEEKRGKDIEAASLILGYIVENQRESYFMEVWNSLSKKQQKAAQIVLNNNEIFGACLSLSNEIRLYPS
jgi:hypothetical protein